MAAPQADRLPEPADLERLLNTESTGYWFASGIDSKQRDEILRDMPPDVQSASKFALLNGTLFEPDDEYHAADARDPQPLAYYMATHDENVPDEHVRAAADYWDIDHYKLDDMNFVDFRGYPGDNAAGAGVFWYDGGEPVEICMNNDDWLEASMPEYARAIAKFNAWRAGEEPEDDDDQ